jgi:hypothetical protein
MAANLKSLLPIERSRWAGRHASHLCKEALEQKMSDRLLEEDDCDGNPKDSVLDSCREIDVLFANQ